MDELNKDKLDDFSSLFLHDLLHPSYTSSGTNSVKQEEMDQSIQQMLENNPGEQNSYHNNTFQTHNHYANFIPLEVSSMAHFGGNKHMGMPLPLYAANPSNMDMLMNNNSFTSVDKGSGTDLGHFFRQNSMGMSSMVEPYLGTQHYGGQLMSPQPNTPNESARTRKKPKKKKAKTSNFYQIDYKPKKLTRLLDLKGHKVGDYNIVDKDGHEIKVKFNAFLNGRFFSNDVDNNNYILARNETDRSLGKKDPKVISCYRRNFIQMVFNLNLSDFILDNKVLKLQSSEYGYTITRIIKWFKIEVFASTDMADVRNVPIIIKDDNKDKDPKNELKSSMKLIPISSDEHIITFNNSTIINNEIDNYYVVKKLQFKNATPNNGNLTFQNYYQLKVRLKAIIADLYYDDYMDEDFSATHNQDNNEIILFELNSEPIIVRGRNPSFYTERKDVLIKGRSSLTKDSFVNIENYNSEGGEDLNDLNDANDINDINNGDFPLMENRETSADNNGEDEEFDPYMEGLEVPGGLLGGSKQPELNTEQESNSEEIQELSDEAEGQILKTGPTLGTNPSSIDFKSLKGYNYFPISNVYYLPPINVVWFPHGAHQQKYQTRLSELEDSVGIELDATSRRSSNIYFKS